jgi:hypothetical protein
MKAVCVGRFLIDLPETAEVTFSAARVDGFDVSTRLETADQFAARVAAREADIKRQPNELGKKNIEMARQVKFGGLEGRMLRFGRWRTYRIEDDRRIYSENVALEGHVHDGDVSFDLATAGYDPARAGNLAKLIGQITQTAANVRSPDPGFCIDHGMVRDPLTADQNESVTMFAGIPGHPDLGIVFSTMAGTERGPGMLARSAAASARQPFYVRALFSTLRQGSRVINGLPGEELAVRVREINLTTGFNFDWEMGGAKEDVFAPLLTLELQAGASPQAGGRPVDSSLSQAALGDLWDHISSSIRLRPVPPPAPATRP